MEENITSVITQLVFQLAVIIFAVRIFGRLAVKVGIPSVLGELVAGIIIGPYALGSISLPGFASGLFPLYSETLAVTPELYAFGQVASIILLFSSGIETDLSLFIKYSVSGGVIGLGGVVFSFLLGDLAAVMMLSRPFMDSTCLFFGIMSTATSVGITARILSDRKKMDSPEGVTTLAAAVFDDVLGIVLLAVVMGIVQAKTGTGSLSGSAIGIIALKAFSIWLVFTVILILASKWLSKFVRLFGGAIDFSIASFGLALVLSGIFERQGLAMIIGAYTTGLALSKTEIAPIIQEKIHVLYKFFVPVFFAVMGMSVNVRALADSSVLVFGAVYTLLCVVSKVFGCGFPSFFLGFNTKGALRIGCGMIPRGEVALITAGIGLTAGIVNQSEFAVVILMTLVTTLFAPPLLNMSLKMKGRGTKKETKESQSQIFVWDFKDSQIAHMVLGMFISDLRSEGFFVQMMNISDGITQARKDDIALSAQIEESTVTIETDAKDMGFVKGEIYEVILKLNKSLETLKSLNNTSTLQYGFASPENRTEPALFKLLKAPVIQTELKANTKEEVLVEMADLLEKSGKVTDKEELLKAIRNREATMSTGMQDGIALPHAKTDGVSEICLAVGIKREGLDFASLDKQPSKVFVMIAAPASKESPMMQVMAAISGVMLKKDTLQHIVDSKSADQVISLIKEAANKK